MRSLDDCLGRGRKSNSIVRSQFNLVKCAASKTRNCVDCGWVLYFFGIFGANALPLTWCILHLDEDNPQQSRLVIGNEQDNLFINFLLPLNKVHITIW